MIIRWYLNFWLTWRIIHTWIWIFFIIWDIKYFTCEFFSLLMFLSFNFSFNFVFNLYLYWSPVEIILSPEVFFFLGTLWDIIYPEVINLFLGRSFEGVRGVILPRSMLLFFAKIQRWIYYFWYLIYRPWIGAQERTSTLILFISLLLVEATLLSPYGGSTRQSVIQLHKKSLINTYLL